MDSQTSLTLINHIRAEKQAAGLDDVAGAVQGIANQQLQADAGADIKNIAMAALGLGVGARGAVGLYNLLKSPAKARRSGPAELPLPYPVESQHHDEEPATLPFSKAADISEYFDGSQATTKAGLPWYGPGALFAGMGGLAAGWKGLDMALDHQRQKEREDELVKAKQEFHDALLSQYDKPLAGIGMKKKAAETEMEKIGADLDGLFDLMEKAAFNMADVGGAALGGYGMYAGVSGLLAGSLIYDAVKKRSRSSVLDKALKRRQRRNFMQAPTEIYAVPEPVEAEEPAQV